MTTAAAIRTTPHVVAPRNIPDALRTIWRDCCAGADQAVTRALTHNFVAVVDRRRAADLRHVVDELAERRPCRAFFVVVDAADGSIEVEVAGTARRQGAMLVLLLERIDLRTPRREFAHVAGIVRPLLVNDIPTHLYWATEWPDPPRAFDELADMVDHVVVDSARSSAPARQIEAIEQRRAAGLQAIDLAWLRLRPWRRALAEGFERVPYDASLGTTVAIRHGDAGVAAAHLLARWLRDRLGAETTLQPTGDGAAGLTAVELRHGEDEIVATATEPARIVVHATTRDACFLPYTVPASRGNETGLLAAAIDLA